MRYLSTLALILMSMNAVEAGANAKAKAKEWKYAGEDHGIQFFFKTGKSSGKGVIQLKLVNTSDRPLEVDFRIRDTDWSQEFTRGLQGSEADSTLQYRPQDGGIVRYPYIDRVFIDAEQEMQGQIELSQTN